MIKMLVAKSPARSMAGYHAVRIIEALGPKLEERATEVGTASLDETLTKGIPFTGNIIPDTAAMQ